MRVFDSGSTRNDDSEKYDYEGFLSPLVLEAFAAYMHQHRKQADGNLRSSDNWQKGMPPDQYMKSLLRHVMAAWKAHRSGTFNIDDWMAILFNTQGYVLEQLKLGVKEDERMLGERINAWRVRNAKVEDEDFSVPGWVTGKQSSGTIPSFKINEEVKENTNSPPDQAVQADNCECWDYPCL